MRQAIRTNMESDMRIAISAKSFSGGALVAGLVLMLFIGTACSRLYDRVGGHFSGPPGALPDHLSPAARRLVEAAFAGLDAQRLADVHVHVLGVDGDGTGASVNPTARSWRHPIRRAQFRVYLSAAGVPDGEETGRLYIERLLELIEAQPVRGRYFLYAMDHHYREDGSIDAARTPFYVPNRYVHELAVRWPEYFVPVVSVHPHRPDALAALERWAARGVRFVKWLPNSMGIDPGSEQLTPFYRKLVEKDMVLLVHTGRELAVPTGGRQHFGNPLRLRLPLELGVTVVALHCASDGRDRDLDHPRQPRVPSFELLLRLLDEPRYRDRLYGEISSVTFFNHLSRALETLLARPDLHHRLVNGSDYPLPGINLLIMTGRLARLGFITLDERRALNELYRYNPLLFDFVVKRTVRHPRSGQKFSNEVFLLPPGLQPRPGLDFPL